MRDSLNIISKISNLYIYIMVKSYCVKQKKQTECAPGSERYVKTKNGRTMMKCTCAECGITKTKFVKSQSTGGAIAGSPTKPYCGINKVPKGKHLGSRTQCIDQGQVRLYGINNIPKIVLEKIKKAKLTKSQKKKLNELLSTKKQGN